jgi:putative FmdB family regulatory protein
MPIYEFHCNRCNKDFEMLLMGSDKPICPTCKTDDIYRLLSACGFLSKGEQGQTTRASAGQSSCSGCSATSCSSCGH